MDRDLLYKVFVIYLGTFCLMAGPFFIDGLFGKLTMILGLCLVTIQTQRTKSYNLSLLNMVGAAGYIYSIFS